MRKNNELWVKERRKRQSLFQDCEPKQLNFSVPQVCSLAWCNMSQNNSSMLLSEGFIFSKLVLYPAQVIQELRSMTTWFVSRRVQKSVWLIANLTWYTSIVQKEGTRRWERPADSSKACTKSQVGCAHRGCNCYRFLSYLPKCFLWT